MRNKILSLMLGLVLLLSCKEVEESAIIEVQKEINFGTIHSNESVSKVFKIKNISTTNLIIKNIKTSCGCTVAKLSDSIINPNDKVELKVKFVASKEKIGKIKNSIVVESNTNPVFTVLYLKGNVVD
ncbi:DUF1573 domain-containing protein [Flavobacterium sp. 20NA77.7]|uniref:DUF1573 domain-containing protein n=1 Tax=Flavobacterium nakdongensis TaxID=3073563 RepID=A0ABY9RA66_9FLAO|nr:DUF1573 domain-containing protein [Flavobacterium sp. 20NA77.7]WMW77689.1 DUF1573 domain-containing protein [Flavobacterium sp. 20NA77.7]